MINVKNFISGKGLKIATPIALGVTGVSLGAVGLARYDSLPTLLETEFKKLKVSEANEQLSTDFTALRDSIITGNKEWQESNNLLISKYIDELTEVKNLLTAQKRTILDTKNKEVDLSPVIDKIECVLALGGKIQGQQSEHTDQLKEIKNLLTAQKETILESINKEADLSPIGERIDSILATIEKNHKELFIEVNDNYEAVMDTINHINNEDFIKHKAIMNALGAQKETILETKILETDLTPVLNKLERIERNIWNNKTLIQGSREKIIEEIILKENNDFSLYTDLVQKLKVVENKVLGQMVQHAKINTKHIQNQINELKNSFTVSDEPVNVHNIEKQLNKIMSEISDINAFNEQEESKQKAINNQLLQQSKYLVNSLEDLKEGQRDINNQLVNIVTPLLKDIEKDIWMLDDNVGLWAEQVEETVLTGFKGVNEKIDDNLKRLVKWLETNLDIVIENVVEDVKEAVTELVLNGFELVVEE